MRSPFIALLLSALVASVGLAGCAASTAEAGADLPVSDDAAITFSVGPEGLAQWLGTNHSLSYLAQFVDTRNGPEGGLLPTTECCQPGNPLGLAFPRASRSSDVIQQVAAVGRKYDADHVRISLGPSSGPGVYVYAQKPSHEATLGTSLTPAETYTLALTRAEATVVVAFIPEDPHGTIMFLNFGIVSRPLTLAAKSPVNDYWTIRGVDIHYDPAGDPHD